jgi:hypothetical protein
VQVGGDLGLADCDPRRLAAALMPASVDQPHLVASNRRVQLGFVKQLTFAASLPESVV